MPGNLASLLAQVQQDSDYLNCRAEIELLTVRICERLGQIETGATASLWEELRKRLANLVSTLEVLCGRQWEEVTVGIALQSVLSDLHGLASTVATGNRTEETWKDLRSLIDQTTRTKARETKRIVQLQAAIPIERVIGVVIAIGQSIKRHVNDPVKEGLIGADIRDYLNILEVEMNPTAHRPTI